MDVRLLCRRRHRARNERCMNKVCLCRWNVVCANLSASKLNRDFSCCCPTSMLWGTLGNDWSGVCAGVRGMAEQEAHLSVTLPAEQQRQCFTAVWLLDRKPKKATVIRTLGHCACVAFPGQAMLKIAWEMFAATPACSCWHPWGFAGTVSCQLVHFRKEDSHHPFPS